MSRTHGLPLRPLVPPTVAALVSSLLACGLALRLGWGVSPVLLSSALMAAALGGMALFWGSGDCGRRGRAATVVGFTLLGGALALVPAARRASSDHATASALQSSPLSLWDFRLEEDPKPTSQGWRVLAAATGPQGEHGEVWLSSSEAYGLGDHLRVVGRFSPLDDGEWGRSCAGQGICGNVRVVRVTGRDVAVGPWGLVLALRRGLLSALSPGEGEGRALLAGSVCGFVPAMSERGLDELFARCGVSHLVAVSGGHLVIVAALLSQMLSMTKLGPWARLAIVQLFCLVFVFMCGCPVSAVRSWLMALVVSLAQPLGRRAHSLSAAVVAGTLMLLADPAIAGRLSFLLSLSSVVGLCLFAPYCSYLLSFLMPGIPVGSGASAFGCLAGALASVRDLLAATLVAQAVTLPLSCSVFSQLSLVAPLANVLLALPFSAMLGLGLVTSCLFWCAPLAAPLLSLCDLLCKLVLALLRALARLPLASVPVSIDLGAALLLVLLPVCLLLWRWPRMSRSRVLCLLGLPLALAVAFLVRWTILAPARLCVLDVGQGDAVLVQDGVHALLVDTGPDGSAAQELASLHVLGLDGIVLTHLHDDHVGGLKELSSLGCGKVYVARGVARHVTGPLAEEVRGCSGGDAQELAYGDVITVGHFSLRLAWPKAEVDGSENAHSIELLASYDWNGRSLSALLTGDAERDETKAVVDARGVGDIDVLKVGHHGSKASIYPDTARALDPELSVASAGEHNRYGHPSRECKDTLSQAGSLFLCTKDVGTVCIEPGSEGVVVRCDRQAIAEAANVA